MYGVKMIDKKKKYAADTSSSDSELEPPKKCSEGSLLVQLENQQNRE